MDESPEQRQRSRGARQYSPTFNNFLGGRPRLLTTPPTNSLSKLICCICPDSNETNHVKRDKKGANKLAELRRAERAHRQHRSSRGRASSSKATPRGKKHSESRRSERLDHQHRSSRGQASSSKATPKGKKHSESRRAERSDRQLRASRGQASSSHATPKSKMNFHHAAGPVEVPCGSSSRSSDNDFQDARDYFSETDSDVGAAPLLSRRKSILKRCKCAACAGLMHELGSGDCFRNADACDKIRERKSVRLNGNLFVAEYDLRSGVIQEERLEELNVSEVPVPIGRMKNPLKVHVEERIVRARETLRNLFSADRPVFYDSDEDDDIPEEELSEDEAEEEIQEPELIADEEEEQYISVNGAF